MFFDQVFSTMVLATTVLGVTDPSNANPGGLAPLLIGLAAATMGLCFGSNAGLVKKWNTKFFHTIF